MSSLGKFKTKRKKNNSKPINKKIPLKYYLLEVSLSFFWKIGAFTFENIFHFTNIDRQLTFFKQPCSNNKIAVLSSE